MSTAVAGRAPALSLAGLATFARHQTGALIVTALDFGVMSLCVRFVGLSAVTGTVLGAFTGGVTNFLLGRRWIFASTTGDARGQALRYALVSFASLVLNAAGEYLLHDRLGIQFQIARAIVAAMVSVAWNFPMHRSFVFQPKSAPSSP